MSIPQECKTESTHKYQTRRNERLKSDTLRQSVQTKQAVSMKRQRINSVNVKRGDVIGVICHEKDRSGQHRHRTVLAIVYNFAQKTNSVLACTTHGIVAMVSRGQRSKKNMKPMWLSIEKYCTFTIEPHLVEEKLVSIKEQIETNTFDERNCGRVSYTALHATEYP